MSIKIENPVIDPGGIHPIFCTTYIRRFDMQQLYLSRRNLEALLSKLDRKKAGDVTACTLIKNDTEHPKYPQTMKNIMVTAVENEEYYIDREPGYIDERDVK
jgi:hypothetical protein